MTHHLLYLLMLAAAPAGNDATADDKVHKVLYHGNPAPIEFRGPAFELTAAQRAQKATSQLEAAIDAEDSGAQVVVEIVEGAAKLKVGSNVLFRLTPEDAAPFGATLPEYSEGVRERLSTFIPTQKRRHWLQNFFLRLFLSVFVLVVMFVTLRSLRDAFDRWDSTLDEKRGTLVPLSVFRIPVVSREALGGGLAFGLAVGRIAAYTLTVVAAMAFVLSQFEITRPILAQLGALTSQPLVDAFEAIIGAIPGVLLAAILFYLARAGLRVLNLLLDGVQTGQIQWKRVPARRVPVVRNLAPVLLVLLIAPLMIAAVFGRFGTPLESIATGCGFVVLVGAIPLVASAVTGFVILWTEGIQLGDWVSVGDVSGEVADITFRELKLVPASGGTIGVPYLLLVLRPIHRLREPPLEIITLSLRRDRPAKEICDLVREAVCEKEPDARVEIFSLDGGEIHLRIAASATRSGVRQLLLLTVSELAEEKQLQFAPGASR